ncbi:WapI family immunity protein [Diaminobutyricibacter sp. McL0608]|uniref:WapI family immunity protein n=1 Tax=Leifsonia sp. McL0608 TaxID=3143537 RepID=UPI0031F3284D
MDDARAQSVAGGSIRAPLSIRCRAVGQLSDRKLFRLGGLVVQPTVRLAQNAFAVLDDGLMDEIALGGAHNEITIRIAGRERPDDLSWEDGNWLVGAIKVDVDGMTANLDRVALRADELRVFSDEMAEVYQNLTGTARLISTEAWISLAIKANPNGTVEAGGIVRDKRRPGNELQFALRDLDQTHLAPMIDSLQQTSERYPVVGGR